MHKITSRPPEAIGLENLMQVKGFDVIKEEYSNYLTDESKLTMGSFDFLLFPRDESELAGVVGEMARKGVCVTVAGARTGLVGGCVPAGGALISLEKLNHILDLYYLESADEWRLRAEAGALLSDLNTMITEKSFPDLEKNPDPGMREKLNGFRKDPARYFYPPDPKANIEWVGFGHAGNNHFHVSSMPRDMEELAKGIEIYTEFAEKAVFFGGTVSAEHGIGKIKAKYLKTMYSDDQIAQMQCIKKAFDPDLLLNPGNIFIN